VSREINLSGGEITLLKTLGLSGAAMPGSALLERMAELEAGELIDTLDGLLTMGYVLANRVNIRTAEDVGRAMFRVNQSYARELREALHPGHRGSHEQRRRRRRG
jgi:hypothetical protein